MRDLRRVRNEQRTRKRRADHSPFRWRFATPAQGREQPSGPASGRQSAPNRGVAHAPTDSAGCKRRAADGTKRRPQKDPSRSPEVAGAATGPTAWTPCCPVVGCPRISGPAGSVPHANHRLLSRLPSRRQPFQSGCWDHREKRAEKFIKSLLGSRAGSFAASKRTDRAHAGRQHSFSGGVSDHVAGRRLGRTGGHFGWSRTPRDWRWRPHWQCGTRWAAQSAARRRRPVTCATRCSCSAPSPRASRVRRPGRALVAGASRGNTSREGPVPPPCSPSRVYRWAPSSEPSRWLPGGWPETPKRS